MKKLLLLLLLPLLLLTSCGLENKSKPKYNYCVHFETYDQTTHYICSEVRFRADSSWLEMQTRDYGKLNANGNYLIYDLPSKCPVCGWEESL